jgi:hypothetical protein
LGGVKGLHEAELSSHTFSKIIAILRPRLGDNIIASISDIFKTVPLYVVLNTSRHLQYQNAP